LEHKHDSALAESCIANNKKQIANAGRNICYLRSAILQFRLWSRAKRPWILKSAGMSVVRGRTKVYVIPLLFDRSLGRTLLCVSAPEQRDRTDEQQDGTRSHQFRGRSESDSHKSTACFLHGIRILVDLVVDSLHKIARGGGTSKGADDGHLPGVAPDRSLRFLRSWGLSLYFTLLSSSPLTRLNEAFSNQFASLRITNGTDAVSNCHGFGWAGGVWLPTVPVFELSSEIGGTAAGLQCRHTTVAIGRPNRQICYVQCAILCGRTLPLLP
jgi:hypothetical protein